MSQAFEDALDRGDAAAIDELIKLQLIAVDEIFDDGFSPLMNAALHGLCEIGEVLIRAGALVDQRGKLGATPLCIACQSGHADFVAMLLAQRADADAVRDNGSTPLHVACKLGHISCMEQLLQCGADVNLACENGYTPLMRACENGHVAVVEQLAMFLAELDCVSNDGFTPLRIACAANQPECVSVLLRAGCHADLTSQWTRADGTQAEAAALEVACAAGHLECVQLLLQAGVSRATMIKAIHWCKKTHQSECGTAVKNALADELANGSPEEQAASSSFRKRLLEMPF